MKILPMAPAAPPSTTGPATGGVNVVADAAKTEALKPAIVAALAMVFDPEIPVNIWELGLIYDIAVDASGVAGIRMTLTSPGCPVAQSLPVDVARKVKSVAGVSDARVEIVWEPEWTRDRMSDVAKLQLGMW